MTERRPTLFDVVAGAAVVMLAAGLLKPFYFQMLSRDRAPIRAALSRVAFGKMPGFENFLEEVRARTAPGDTIALVVPMTEWQRIFMGRTTARAMFSRGGAFFRFWIRRIARIRRTVRRRVCSGLGSRSG